MKRLIIFLCSLLALGPLEAKPVEIVLWHAMAGHLGKGVRQLAQQFNQEQKDYIIKPIYKGDYIETLTSFAAAFRAHQPPDMVQVLEVGTATMISPKGVIKPVEALMKEQGLELPLNDFIPVLRDFYSQNGQLMAMPLNQSTPILYYNRDVLKQVGYDGSHFPTTWQEMETLAIKLKQAGYSCTYTSANPSWILVEAYLAIHGLAETEKKPLKAIYDYPQFIAHLDRLKRWQKEGYFRYGGRLDDATVLFTSGICPLFSQSSGSYKSLKQLVHFNLDIAPLPLDTKASQVRHANVVGGAALWVVSGRSAEKEKGIAQFLLFLSQPKTQKQWHEYSGYLPIGLTGIYAALASESQLPTLKLARVDLAPERQQGFSPNNDIPQNQIRLSNEEALEALFAHLKTPEKATKDAVAKANHLIQRYLQTTSIS